jgi:hypothetical protein
MGLSCKSASLVALTLGEVALLGFSSVECILDARLPLALLLVVLALLALLALWGYVAALLTPHSPCEDVWGRVDQRGAAVNELHLDESIHGTPTCEACDAQQLQRSNHCAVCDVCVMRFEKHSAWLGKCVGLENLKLYILAHAYFALFCGTVLAVHIVRLTRSRFFDGAFWLVLAAAGAYVAATHLFFSGRLALLHAWLVATGRTELEWRGGDRRSHDVGLAGNVASVIGSQRALALLPVAPRFDRLPLEWFVAQPQREVSEEDNAASGSEYARLVFQSSPVRTPRTTVKASVPKSDAGAIVATEPRSQEQVRAWLQDSNRFPRSTGAFLNPELSDDRE